MVERGWAEGEMVREATEIEAICVLGETGAAPQVGEKEMKKNEKHWKRTVIVLLRHIQAVPPDLVTSQQALDQIRSWSLFWHQNVSDIRLFEDYVHMASSNPSLGVPALLISQDPACVCVWFHKITTNSAKGLYENTDLRRRSRSGMGGV